MQTYWANVIGVKWETMKLRTIMKMATLSMCLRSAVRNSLAPMEVTFRAEIKPQKLKSS